MASYARGHDDEGNPIKVNPDFVIDSARVYISQKSDIDEYFHLVDGKVGNPSAASAVGIKADEVRLVARGGIKLVTGTDMRDSQGDRIFESKGIDLIAGNDDSDMQPLVKGDNLVKCLFDMNRSIKDLFGMINIIQKALVDHHFNYSTHTHPVAKAVALPAVQAALMSPTNHMKLAAKASSLAFNIGRTQSQYLSVQGGEKHYINSFRNHAN